MESPLRDHPHNRLADPKVFGPGKWDTLHSFAIQAQTPENHDYCLRAIHHIINTLKCPTCREHARQYAVDVPPELAVLELDDAGRPLGLFKWSWTFHNAVNQRLHKPQPDYETAVALYWDDAAGVCTNCGQAEDPLSMGVSAIHQTLVGELPPSYNHSVLSPNPPPIQTHTVTYIPTAHRARMASRNTHK